MYGAAHGVGRVWCRASVLSAERDAGHDAGMDAGRDAMRDAGRL